MQEVHKEQAAVAAMYRRLDQDLADARDAHRQALATPIEDPHDLYARDVEVGRLTRIIKERQVAEHALCFGRIDTTSGASIHIGRVGLRDDAGTPVLVDWRADAAKPFYAATAIAPEGLRRRRHLRLDGRRVVGVSDELLDGSPPTSCDVVGDGPLAEALGQARTGYMREAISTLQAEQDAIVRSANRGITVVQGGPGTGKTIIALHRAAYVLYAFPHMAERGVLVYGPNRRFLDYIGDVLPSLGENDVELSTTTDLVAVEPSKTDEPTLAERKGRVDMADALATFVRAHQPGKKPLTVRIGHDTLSLEAAVIDSARLSALRDAHAHNPARKYFKEYVIDELVDRLEQRAAESLQEIDAEVASVLGIDLDRAVAADLQKLGFADAPVSDGQPEFDRESVRASLMEDSDLDLVVDRVWRPLDPQAMLRRFLVEQVDTGEAWLGFTAHDIQKREQDEQYQPGLSRADLALLDELRSLVVGPPERTFGHIVVDEAQELSEMEWRMLMRRCPSRSMTIVGDLAQAGEPTTVQSWGAALQPFVGDRFELHTLTVNYRTTTEILEESAPLLAEIAPEQRLSQSVRHGEIPRALASKRGEMVSVVHGLVDHELESHPGELIGVICPAVSVTALKAVLNEKATVVAAPDVRGLEFDTTVLVDPAAIRASRAAGARDLYVAMTRATRRLIIVEPVPASTDIAALDV
ncbi:helicase [Agromyces sp. NPDC049794]|uniref:HelD family protein n=1 Tax=unclassified Agromyces TaxID=2639701 RepID=UPI00340E94E9